MADIRWFVLVDVKTGEHHDTASIDLDDPDTAIDEATGKPYSKSGMRGISHPVHSAELGYEAIEIPFNPQLPPEDDPDGRHELDAAAYLAGDKANIIKKVSGADIRLRQLTAIRQEEARLTADMKTRGETVPARSTRA